ncbi:MAG: exodeoxyribonuclease VII large subunit [Lachnospiraceae bacterium]|nr:exodeoxyribonuclease VII large subunit [Lachnospiraceae bacterium]
MQSVYTVAQINTYIKNMFVQDYLLSSVSVKGEVSNCKYHSSGHIYFTLKDKLSVIACVMFAGNRRGLSFSLKEGMQVVVSGKVDTFERDGKYQLYAVKIEQDGLGELYEKFLRLKEDLEDRGMFAAEYKKAIPTNIKTLGVVTAPTGAAVRDIISIAKTRNPYIQIIVYPAIVQGENAAPSIVRGIQALDDYGVDTIIVGRGGGSLEDLWAFNEEIVAEAIFNCRTPIISAVGHETDISISDYVADHRAETPSAAAQLAVSQVRDLLDTFDAYRDRLELAMGKRIELSRRDVLRVKDRLLSDNPVRQLNEKRMLTVHAEERLRSAMDKIINLKKERLSLLASGLNGVSPLMKLNQGFSFTEDMSGRCISSVDGISKNEQFKTYVRDGYILGEVREVVALDMNDQAKDV